MFVLLTRLAQIPSRIVTGYYGGDLNEIGNFFQFKQKDTHAWAEVWFNGRWKEVDPGWNEFDIDATHIKLSDDYFSDVEVFIAENIELSGYD